MRKSGQTLVMVAVTVVLLGCFMLVECASPPPIPKPHPPQFNIYLVNHPYDVPPIFPTYTTDPFTGEQKMVNNGSAGYHVDNVTIELWILNEQPSYSNGTTTFTPYYNVRTKGHFEQIWTEMYRPFNGTFPYSNRVYTYIPNETPAQSNFKYTVITYSSTVPAPYYSTDIVTYPPNATVDFQVSAMIGYPSQIVAFYNSFIAAGHTEAAIALYSQSVWSEMLSITISNDTILASTLENPIQPVATPIPIPTDTPPAPTPTAASTPTPTPTIHPPANRPNFWLSLDAQVAIGLVIAILALIVAVISLIYRKHRKSNCSKEHDRC